MRGIYETYKDYRDVDGYKASQEDCKVFKCTCEGVIYYVVSKDSGKAIELLRKYVKGKSYSAKWNSRYYISMLEDEEDAMFTEQEYLQVLK